MSPASVTFREKVSVMVFPPQYHLVRQERIKQKIVTCLKTALKTLFDLFLNLLSDVTQKLRLSFRGANV